MFACLLGPTTHHKSLLALIWHVLHHPLVQKGLEDTLAVNCEQSTSSMVATTTRGHAYSVSRVIEVTACQSVDAVKSLLPDLWFLSLDRQISWLQSWGLPVAHTLWSVLAISTWPAACVGAACVHCALGLTHSFLCCTFCVIFLGLRFSPILVTVICMQLVYVLHVHLLEQAHPTMSYIHLVLWCAT